jgi:hypothetical protein
MQISSAFPQASAAFSNPSSPAPKDQITLSSENASVTAAGNLNGRFRLNRQTRPNGVVFTLTAL